MLEQLATRIGSRCADLPQGLVLLPIPEQAMPEKWTEAEDEFSHLSPAIAEEARARSTSGVIAYIEGSSSPGEAIHRAIIWRGGSVAWGPRHTCNREMDPRDKLEWAKEPQDMAINAAMRELGVQRGDAFDEYAALGLDAKRSTEDWLS